MAHLRLPLRVALSGDDTSIEDWEVWAETNLPRFLYHIQHVGSQSLFYGPNFSLGLKAAETSCNEFSLHELAIRALEHQDWYNKRPSCFISAFDNKRHARNWAKKFMNEPVYMHIIDTNELPTRGQWVFSVPQRNNKSLDEYLFLHRIPGIAIVGSLMIKDGWSDRKCATAIRLFVPMPQSLIPGLSGGRHLASCG